MDKILIDPHNYHQDEYKEFTDYLENESWSFEYLNNDEDDATVIKSSFNILIETIEDLIEQMPKKGDKSDDCQRMTLQNAINSFSYAVNGIENEDLKEDDDE